MKRFTAITLLILTCTAGHAQVGKHGDLVITAANTLLNSYTQLTQDATAGSTTIHVNDASMVGGYFATPLEAGDLLLIIQVQGATIQGNINSIAWGDVLSYGNCGNHEFAEVGSIQGNTVSLSCPLELDYSQSGKVLVVRVPRLNSLVVQNGASVIGSPWDGNIGGSIAIEVLSFVDVQAGGAINATGIGFRGGLRDNAAGYNAVDFASNAQNQGGAKGESIAGFGPEYAALGGRFGRGAPANGGGGGNAHNAGGGGGANAGQTDGWTGQGNPDNGNPAWATAWDLEGGGFSTSSSSGGGRGGYTFSMGNQNALALAPGNAAWNGDNRRNVGGVGGRPLEYLTGRIFYGGGGGAGDGNNGAGTDGANGGGLVYIRCYGTIGGAGQILANGQDSPPTPANGNDAPGGGGGGGTIILNTLGGLSGLNLTVRGGLGGDQVIGSNEAEGPGGGGGGGYIALSLGVPGSTDVSGGANGVTNSQAMTEFPPNGATAGGDGILATHFMYDPLVTVSALDDTVCYGGSTTLTAMLAGAMPNGGQVMWYDQASGGNVIATGSNLPLGPLYSDTVVYVGICPGTYRDTVRVEVEDIPTFSMNANDVLCNGGLTGQAWVENVVTPGNYSVIWNTIPAQTGDTASSLPVGTYQATVVSDNGCSDSAMVVIDQPDLLIAQIINVNHVQCDPGSAEVQVHGGTAPFTYLWYPSGGTSTTATGLVAGIAIVQVTDSNACVALANVDILDVPDVSLSYSATPVTCYGMADGTVDLDITGGMAPYSVDFGLGVSTDTLVNGLLAGTYQAQVVDAMGCMDQVTVNVLTPTALTAQLIQNQPAYCGQSNGMAEVAGVGGIPGYTYQWSTGASSALVSFLADGAYQVTITDANGCAYDTTLQVGLIPDLTLNPQVTDPTCFGYADGAAGVLASQGVAPYQYAWAMGDTTSMVNGLTQGTYTVQVSDAWGCTHSLDVVLIQPAAIDILTASTDTYCGLAQGDASVTNVTGGTPGYSYLWSTGSTSTSISNLAAGAYQVDVTDANGCVETQLVVVSDQSGMSLALQHGDVTCYGGNDGYADVTLGGNGQAPFSYQWSNGVMGTSNPNIPAGAYTITVTDALGCMAVGLVQVVQPDSLAIIPSVSHVLCNGGNSGSINLSAIGGVPAYSFSVNGLPGGTSYPGLVAGNYTLAVQDAQGCQTVMPVAINQPASLGASFNVMDATCNGFDNAVAEVFVTGGVTPYAYDWPALNATSSIVNGLAPGTYSVVVTDANGCVLTGDTSVGEPAPIAIVETSHTDISCFGMDDGQVDVAISGGVGGYSILWNPGGSANTSLTGLAPGSYAGVVTDANGCQNTIVSHIVQPDSLILENLYLTHSTCNNPNGGVYVVHSGGTGPFNYTWSPAQGNSPFAFGLAAGTYQVDIVDVNGCSASGVAVIDSYGPPTVSATATDVNCQGGNDGEVVIEALGGTAPLSYNWMGVTVSSPIVSGLSAGTYNYTVIDDYGCLGQGTITVNELPALAINASSVMHPTCSYNQDGQVTLQVQGGAAPYSVVWDSDTSMNAMVQSGLAGGLHEVMVQDANGCVSQLTVVLDIPGELIAQSAVSHSVTCHGGADGQAVAVASGGTPAYVYSWSTNPVQTTQMATGLMAGTYEVMVTDANGCVDTAQVTLLENEEVMVDLAADTMICPGEMLHLEGYATGGSVSGLDYLWTDAFGLNATGAVQDLALDTTHWVYLQVSDPNCPGAQDSILVHVAHIYPEDVQTMVLPDSICPGEQAQVSAVSTSPYGPVTFSWSPMAASGMGPHAVYPQESAWYVVSVQNHCAIPVQDSVQVFVYPEPDLQVSASELAGCPEFTTTLSFQGMDAFGVGEVVWNVGGYYTSGNDVEITLTESGVYSVSAVVTNGVGCSYTLTDLIQLEVYPQPEAQVIYSPSSPVELDVVTLSDASVNVVSNHWIIDGAMVGSGTEHSHIFTESGEHMVINVVYSEHGCVDTAFVEIPVLPVLQVFVPNAFTPDDDNYNNYFFPVISGMDLDEYEFMVFDRWGELIFQTRDLYDKWDGRYNGRMVKDDVYVWKLKTKDYSGKKQEYYGHVTVVR